MYHQHSDSFHELSVTSKKHNPSDLTIELALKYLIPHQNSYNKTEIIVGKEIVEDNFGIKRKQNKIIERNIRFDKDEREFYIFYDNFKFWVRPVREPMNSEDKNLYKWTIF